MATKRFQFCLNTSKNCFICFNETIFTPQTGTDLKERKCSLQNIFRYLGINLTELPSLSNKSTSILNKTEIRVSLCSDCSIIMEKFTRDYETFELSRIKVESSLKYILPKLKTTNEAINSEDSDVHVRKHLKIVSELRQNLLTKCANKTGKFLPRIIIRDCNKSGSKSSPEGSFPSPADLPKENWALESINAGGLTEAINEEVEEGHHPETESFPVVESVQEIKLETSSSLKIVPRRGHFTIYKNKKQFLQQCSINGYVPPEHLASLSPSDLKKLSKFKCQPCEKYFIDRRVYSRHVRTHINSRRFNCHLCQRACSSQEVLTRHVKTCHPTFSQEAFKLNQADYENFLSKDDLQTIKKEEFKCPHCPKTLLGTHSYKNHLVTKHVPLLSPEMFEELAKFKCPQCPRYFRTETTLSQHVQLHHNARSFKCGCGMTFASKTLRYQHVRNRHGKLPPVKDPSNLLQCKNCDETFMTIKGLNEHHWKYHLEKKFSCNVCGKMFARDLHRINHEKSHFPKIIVSAE